MERKQFIATAAGVAATLAAAGAALAAPAPLPAQPLPGLSPHPTFRRGQRASDLNLRRNRRRLEEIIDQLQRDQHDYCGHRLKAIDLLGRARNEIELALQCDVTEEKGK